jgi:hypothetical protein
MRRNVWTARRTLLWRIRRNGTRSSGHRARGTPILCGCCLRGELLLPTSGMILGPRTRVWALCPTCHSKRRRNVQVTIDCSAILGQSRKVVRGVINSSIKQTPLQWACFKGHLQIVWLLLKAGLSWEVQNHSHSQDTDPFGNNCVHLAASGGSLVVF